MYYENLTHMDSVSNVFFIELNLPFFYFTDSLDNNFLYN